MENSHIRMTKGQIDYEVAKDLNELRLLKEVIAKLPKKDQAKAKKFVRNGNYGDAMEVARPEYYSIRLHNSI